MEPPSVSLTMKAPWPYGSLWEIYDPTAIPYGKKIRDYSQSGKFGLKKDTL